MEGSGVVLFQYGLAGVTILALSLTVRFLYLKIQDLQDARLKDAIEARDKIAAPLESIAQMTKFIYDKLEESKKRA